MLESQRNAFSQEQTEKVPDNVKILDLPEARYRIIYENHSRTLSPEHIGKADALATEIIVPFDYSSPEGARQAVERRWERYEARRSYNPQQTDAESRSAFQNYLQSKNIPMYLVDLVEPADKKLEHLEMNMLNLALAETLLGTGAAAYLGAKAAQGKPSRRDILKMGGAGLLATKAALHGGVWSATNTDSHRQLEPAEKMMMEGNELLNPETMGFDLTFRASIWAHKLHKIAQARGKELGRKPEIAFQTGLAHSGIETKLTADPASRLAYIARAAKVVNAFIPIKNGELLISPLARSEFSPAENKWIPTEFGRDAELEEIEKSL